MGQKIICYLSVFRFINTNLHTYFVYKNFQKGIVKVFLKCIVLIINFSSTVYYWNQLSLITQTMVMAHDPLMHLPPK